MFDMVVNCFAVFGLCCFTAIIFGVVKAYLAHKFWDSLK